MFIGKPPVARRVPHTNTYHGEAHQDPYHWLRDKKAPETLAYIKAENAYTETYQSSIADLTKSLYDELLGRLQEDDSAVPWQKGPWLYYARTQKGKDYPIHCRKPAAGGIEQVILDENALAKGHKHLGVGALEVSPNHKLLAYSVDTDGSERFELRIRDLATGKDLADRVPGTYYGAEWGNDNETLLYVTIDKAHRPFRAHRHVLGTPLVNDSVLYEETDERFHLSLDKTRSERFVLVNLNSAVTTEVRYLDADQPRGALRLLAKRRQAIEYQVSHHGQHWYVVTNDAGATDFRVVKTPITKPGSSNWQQHTPHRPGVLVQSVSAFRGHLLVAEREGGQRRLVVTDLKTNTQHRVAISEPVHTVSPRSNRDFMTDVLRFSWQSMRTPRTVVDYNMSTRQAKTRKVSPVRGGHDPNRYTVTRLWAPSEGGVSVPISLAHRRDIKPTGANPCLIMAYAAYGYSSEPYFDREHLALLERGFVLAIAHARGGSDLGRKWQDDGKLLAKPHTFVDVISVARQLVATGWSNPKKLALRGGSAGGLMVGATINLAPELFSAALALVPFVDVLNTMMDASLPLTVVEYEEWGDPNDKRFFDAIRSYSPYDNVRPAAYPDLFITAGLNDPRVHYWEPAKWTAKLRRNAKNALIVLKTKMGAGHGGASGRYENLADEALELAFLIDRLGASKVPLPIASQ